MSADHAVDTVGLALARAVTGDHVGGGMLLVPLIEAGRKSCYALAGMLAETASHIARQEQAPGAFGIRVDNTVTGRPASVDVLPPDVRFASQFVTAWANRDQATAWPLFKALADQAEATGGPELVDGILQLFAMAVTTAKAVLAEERARRNPTPED